MNELVGENIDPENREFEFSWTSGPNKIIWKWDYTIEYYGISPLLIEDANLGNNSMARKSIEMI